MFRSLKQRWRRFKTPPSGKRFQAFHVRHHRKTNLARSIATFGAGLLLIAVGLVLLVLPGPGLLIGAIGAALLAGESKIVARGLDWLDLRVTRLWRRWRRQ